MKLDRWTKYPGGVFDNRPTKVLEPIETHDTPAISIRHADGVTLKNCSVSWGGICRIISPARSKPKT